jgi:hypothetical protein
MNLSKSLKKIKTRVKNITVKQNSRKSIRKIPDSIIQTITSHENNYRLSLNKNLVSFRPTPVEKLEICNLRKAFRYEEKLKYKLHGKCYDYDKNIIKEYLLKRLKNNEFVHISQIIAPKQIDSNCWFNSMFMMFFISDRGRIFFHYMRELMITGKTLTTEITDVRLKNAFALLNFIVECCLNGNPLAHHLNTNKIIKEIYNLAKEKNIRIENVGEPGNPIIYYQSLIRFLGKNELKMIVTNFSYWKEELKHIKDPPHIIVINSFLNYHKPLRFKLGKYVYELDSASIIDNGGEHFCSVITCNGIEFAFDGYSKSRLIPFKWKELINENKNWEFKDYIYEFETEAKWNFTKGYSILCYYRVQ